MIDVQDSSATALLQFVFRAAPTQLHIAELWTLKSCWFPSHPLFLAEARAAETAIRETAQLEKNWDGYGAVAVDPVTRANAEAAAAQLLPVMPAPDVTPNSNGTISLEWESLHGIAHLEIGKTRYSFYAKPFHGQPLIGEGSLPESVSGWLAIASVVRALVYPGSTLSRSISPISFTASEDLRA